jgi:hypothetical protein
MLASTEILSQAEQAASTCGGNAPLVEDGARHMRWSGREEVAREADLPCQCAAAAVQYSVIRTYTHARGASVSIDGPWHCSSKRELLLPLQEWSSTLA